MFQEQSCLNGKLVIFAGCLITTCLIEENDMIKSRICDMLGIQYPVFQGGMAWVADASLASAVSNAGGLGLISSVNAGTEAVRNEIRKCKEMTDKPFGVNIMLQAPNAAEIAEETRLFHVCVKGPFHCVTVKINHLLCRWREDL